MTGTILVTGGSGYIAGYLIRQLAAEGWKINATIRSLGREAEVRAALGIAGASIRFFAADLTDDAGWAEAAAGCSHVAHVASPFPLKAVKHEDELIAPARDGALRALRFAAAAGVGRFVMTSSVAAVAYGHKGAERTLPRQTGLTSLHRASAPISNRRPSPSAPRGTGWRPMAGRWNSAPSIRRPCSGR